MKIAGFHGYNVKFSPHNPNEVGIVGGYNFGMTGMASEYLVCPYTVHSSVQKIWIWLEISDISILRDRAKVI